MFWRRCEATSFLLLAASSAKAGLLAFPGAQHGLAARFGHCRENSLDLHGRNKHPRDFSTRSPPPAKRDTSHSLEMTDPDSWVGLKGHTSGASYFCTHT